MIAAERLRATYWAPADHPAPHQLQARLDEVAAKRLSQALSSLPWPALPREDGSLWFIPRLELDFDVDLGFDDHHLAALWAARIARALAGKMAPESADPEVLHFENQAAYLARFLADTAAERAAGRWYYAAFQGLKHLPPSAALRTAICDRAAPGWEALRRIPAVELPKVLAALTEPDARRVVERLTAGSGGDGDPPVAALISAWQAVRGVTPASESAAALLLLLTAARQRGEAPGASASAAALAVVGLARLLQELPSARAGDVVESLAAGRLDHPDLEPGRRDARALAPLLGSPPELLRALLPQPRPVPSEPDRRYTPFGGVFLLLPLLGDLPIDAWFDEPHLIRLWILTKCLGQARAYPFFLDPVVRDLLGIDPELSSAAFVRWQRRAPRERLRGFRRALEGEQYRRDNAAVEYPADRDYLRLPRALRASRERDEPMSAAARLLLRNFAWRLPGFAQASFPHLFDNFLDFPASLEEQSHRRVVRLGHPPLALVLNLAGISRASYNCSWLDARPFELFPEE